MFYIIIGQCSSLENKMFSKKKKILSRNPLEFSGNMGKPNGYQ